MVSYVLGIYAFFIIIITIVNHYFLNIFILQTILLHSVKSKL